MRTKLQMRVVVLAAFQVAAVAGLAGCAAAAASTQNVARTSAAPPQAPPVPLVDHHQHLLSPTLAALFNGPAPLPAITLNPQIAALVEQRERRWNDRAALADLFTADALLAINEGPAGGFLRGRDAIAGFLSGRFTRPYRLTPVAYAQSGSLASLSGYYTRDERHISYFQLTLSRGADGAWRIATETPTFRAAPLQEAITGAQLVAMLDEAGIRRAVVLSGAFGFGSRNMDITREQQSSAARLPLVRAENAWVAEQAALFPDRLIAFCSFNPLEPFAMAELDRCAADDRFKGLKLHLDESSVDLSNPAHVEQVRLVFAAANRHRMPIVVHVGNNQAGEGTAPENRTNVDTFLGRIVTAAPDVPVQIAHLWGGQGFSEAALAAYADAVSAGAPGTRNLYFDIAEAPLIASQYGERQEEILAIVARRIRQIGLDRILYGSDGALEGHLPPRQAWAQFRANVPLTEEEFRIIASNVAPYLR